MVEYVSPEVIRKKPLSDLITDVFERRVSTQAVKKERRLIMETYGVKFRELVDTLPPEKRDTTAIELQKIFVKLRGVFSEYEARFGDFINNIINWPMIRATPDFPKDRYYQIGLAKAKAWGGFARDTTRTATLERKGFRDYFLPSSIIGAEGGAMLGSLASVPVGIMVGTEIGVQAGIWGGIGTIAGGALLGGALGGLGALVLRLKDRILGEPVVYYDLFGAATSSGSGSSGGSSLHMGGGGEGIDFGAAGGIS